MESLHKRTAAVAKPPSGPITAKVNRPSPITATANGGQVFSLPILEIHYFHGPLLPQFVKGLGRA